MAPGSVIRRMFGPYEREVGEIYRSLYIDIDAFVNLILKWSPHARRILEVGCGEGSVTERLVVAYPESAISAIDITPRIGRLFRGSAERVRFIQCTIEHLSAKESGLYDLVVLSDVIHHVPTRIRKSLLDSIRSVMAPEGVLAFKDWEPDFSLIHGMCYAADRWLTGDRVSFMSRVQMRELLAGSFGEASLRAEVRVAPRWNNLAMLVKPLA
jgi:2-polyprenyl-3-methyl-5-hydroxy-6-metoxy-1,4-benzoquinol methylase